jgi:hypothetical protein
MKFLHMVERCSDKLPYALQGSPLDPAVLVFVAPLVGGYAAVAAIAWLL